MAIPTVADEGVLYRNPRPHVRSRQTYFPSLAVLDSSCILGTVVLGEAFESVDLHTHVVRSMDVGRNWEMQGELLSREAGSLFSDAARISALSARDIVAVVMRYDRSEHPDQGLTSHETMGFVPTQFLLLRSTDGGHTWQAPTPLEPPLVGPCFELCSPVVPLADGRWLLPTSTWRGWDGASPNGMKMVALCSSDQGRTWPEYVEVMADPEQRVIYWESKIVELADGRLLATAWAYDERSAVDLPNQYVISADGGSTWTKPCSTGLRGQTLTPLALADGRVLCVYRRMDRPGLWAVLCELQGDRWVNGDTGPIWGADTSGLTSQSDNMAANFNVLRFGAPCVSLLSDGQVMGAFWCYEDCVSNVRWFVLDVA